MQLLRPASKGADVDAQCGAEILETVPVVMRVIRERMRSHRSGLTVPQFRTLCFATMNEGSSLSDAADFIGLSLPAMSRLVEGLVEKGLMQRRPCAEDRRHVRLSVTDTGEAAIQEARGLAQARLAEAVHELSHPQRSALLETMRTLRTLFAPDPTHHLAASVGPEPAS